MTSQDRIAALRLPRTLCRVDGPLPTENVKDRARAIVFDGDGGFGGVMWLNGRWLMAGSLEEIDLSGVIAWYELAPLPWPGAT